MLVMQIRSEDGKFSLSVDSEQQVVKLGTSMDLGFCGAKKKVCMRCSCNWLMRRFTSND